MSEIIGAVLKSNSHPDYVVGADENYHLGKFLIFSEEVVGIIYNTEIFNTELPDKYFPSQNSNRLEKGILLKVLLLGALKNDHGIQSIPKEILPIGSAANGMTDTQIRDFHVGSSGQLQLRYLSHLQEFSPGLFDYIAGRLKDLLSPSHGEIIRIIERDLLWQKLYSN